MREAIEEKPSSALGFHDQVGEDNPVDQEDAGDAGARYGHPGPADDEPFAVVEVTVIDFNGDGEEGVAGCQAAGCERMWHC